MKIPAQGDRDFSFTLGLALAFLCGLGLRLYLLPDQVFSDDEWHGLHYVIGKKPLWLLTHFSIPGATCIPLNFYTWLLGATIGWSEWMLRLPSLICGALSVVVGPMLARKFIGNRQAVLFAFLLSLSPLLVFYSRLCRPYSAVVLLACSAVFLAAHWMQSGSRRSALLFIITGVLAVYFHLFAVVTIAGPLLAGLICSLWKLKSRNETTGPSFKSWLLLSVITAALTALVVLPPLIDSMHSTFFTTARAGTFRPSALPQIAMLVSGTGQPVLTALFWIALIMGAISLCRRNPWLGWMLLSLYPLHVAALAISLPDSAQSAIVLTRYCIPLVAVSILFVACGIQSTLEVVVARARLQPTIQTVIATAIIAAFALAGPLPQTYIAPNNFTNHGAFQHRYVSIDWRHSFTSDLTPADFTVNTTIRADEVSSFYVQIAAHPDGRPIVEYPMMIGDHFNPLYYYQHFHRRAVIVGYTTDMVLPQGLAAGNIYGNTYIDQVTSKVADAKQLRFRNLVSMDDLATMRAKNVEYIVLHKRFEAELSQVAPTPPDLERLTAVYKQNLGDPVYEDDFLTVFSLDAK